MFFFLLSTLFALGYCSNDGPVFVIPRDFFVSTPGGSAEFRCYLIPGNTLLSIQWIVNETLLENLELNGVSTSLSMQFGIGTLNFVDLPGEYNETRIRCRARFRTSSGDHNMLTSPNATLLLLQGILPAVGSITLTVQNSAAFLDWTEPFRLTNPDDSPDVTYCVDVVNASSTEEPTLISVCEISETSFNYTVPPQSWCYLYLTLVTPVNMAGTGVQGTKSYFGAETSPHLMEVLRVSIDTSDVLTFLLTMSAPVCMIELTFLDMSQGDRIHLGGNDQGVSIMRSNVTFTTERLTTNRLYHVTIKARNIAGQATVVHALSTHDVETASIDRRGVEVTALYSEYSSASGALFSFVFITDNEDVDFSRSFLLALDRNTSYIYTLPFPLYPGRYGLHVYDIEHDGTLFATFPAVTDDRTISGNREGSSFQPEYSYLESCHSTASSGYIEIYCSYPSNSMATGFQVIAQMTNFSEVRKLYTGKTTDRQNSVTVQVRANGTYQVSVLAIRGRMGILNSNVEYRELVSVMENTAPTNIAEHTTTQTNIAERTTSIRESGLRGKDSTDSGMIAGIVSGVVVIFVIILLGITVVVVKKKLSKRRKAQYAVSNVSGTTDNDMSHRHSGSDKQQSSKPPEESISLVKTESGSTSGGAISHGNSNETSKLTTAPLPDVHEGNDVFPGLNKASTSAVMPAQIQNIGLPPPNTVSDDGKHQLDATSSSPIPGVAPQQSITSTPSYTSMKATAGNSNGKAAYAYNHHTRSLSSKSMEEHEYHKEVEPQQTGQRRSTWSSRAQPRTGTSRKFHSEHSGEGTSDMLNEQSGFHHNVSLREEGDDILPEALDHNPNSGEDQAVQEQSTNNLGKMVHSNGNHNSGAVLQESDEDQGLHAAATEESHAEN